MTSSRVIELRPPSHGAAPDVTPEYAAFCRGRQAMLRGFREWLGTGPSAADAACELDATRNAIEQAAELERIR